MSDGDDLETTISTGEEITIDPSAEIAAVLDDLDGLLKNGEVTQALGARGVNTSLALTAVAGLRAYLAGDKAAAAEDFATVAEEIAARLAASSESRNGVS
jgi:hypothetical protein